MLGAREEERDGEMEGGCDGGMKRERRRTMEVEHRLTFSTTACQINEMSVQLARSLPRGNPRVHWRRKCGHRGSAGRYVLYGMSQQKRNHFIAGAEKLARLPLSFRVSLPSVRVICHQGLYTEHKLRQKWLPICRRCFRRCPFMKGGRLNASEGEQRMRGGKLSGEPGPWQRHDALKLSLI